MKGRKLFAMAKAVKDRKASSRHQRRQAAALVRKEKKNGKRI